MKTLLTIFLLAPAICFAQLRQNMPRSKSIRTLHSKIDKNDAAKYLIAANAVIFVVQEFALHNNDKQLKAGAIASYFAVNSIGLTYIFTYDNNRCSYDLQKQRCRVQLLHRWKVQVHSRRWGVNAG